MVDVAVLESPLADPAAGAVARKVRVPTQPHMPVAQVARLKAELTKAECFLEYGAGGSTYFAGELGVRRVFSVESDTNFARAVRIKTRRAFPNTELRMLVPDLGETGRWGMPVDDSKLRNWPDYTVKIWSEMAKFDADPDVVLIDGRFRLACCLMSLSSAKAGATIMFDDYVGRENKYGVAEKYAPIVETIEKMAIFKVPTGKLARSLAADLVRACFDPA